MIFLPVAERELRVASRKRGSYLIRTLAAAVALLIGGLMSLPYLLGGMGSAQLGNALFGILTWLLFITCLSAGLFFTSDCISQEKREGTLGFLFLTDLRGFDVLIGKLLATSLRASYASLAVLPVLAVPLLMGGVEAGQFWKSCLAILNAVLCSLTAGIFVSTLSRSAARAFSATLLLLCAWCALGPIISLTYHEFSGRPSVKTLEFASPFFPFLAAEPGTPRGHFFKALLLNFATAGALLFLSSVLVRRTWQEGRAIPATAAGRKFKFGLRGPRARRRLRKWMDPNPMIWLVSRAGRQADGVWILALLASAVVVITALVGIPREGWMFWNVFGSLFSLFLFVLVGAQAPRAFVEARQNGLMELLLSTPLRAEEIITGHWRAQVRMFTPPLIIFLVVHFAATFYASSAMWGGLGSQLNLGVPQLLLGMSLAIAAVVSILADVAALSWFGMWMGMTSKNTNMAALKTIVFVQVAPALVIQVLSSLLMMLVLLPFLATSRSGTTAVSVTGGMMPLLFSIIPTVLRLGKDGLFILWSRKKLRQNFRNWAAPAVAQGWSLAVPPVIPHPPPK